MNRAQCSSTEAGDITAGKRRLSETQESAADGPTALVPLFAWPLLALAVSTQQGFKAYHNLRALELLALLVLSYAENVAESRATVFREFE